MCQKDLLLLPVWPSLPAGGCSCLRLTSQPVAHQSASCPAHIGRKQASSKHVILESTLNWPIWSWRDRGGTLLEQLFALDLNHRDSCCFSVCFLSVTYDLSLKMKPNYILMLLSWQCPAEPGDRCHVKLQSRVCHQLFLWIIKSHSEK